MGFYPPLWAVKAGQAPALCAFRDCIPRGRMAGGVCRAAWCEAAAGGGRQLGVAAGVPAPGSLPAEGSHQSAGLLTGHRVTQAERALSRLRADLTPGVPCKLQTPSGTPDRSSGQWFDKHR